MITDFFKTTFDIYRLTSSDQGGIETKSYQKIATVLGWMRPLHGSEIRANEKRTYVTTHRMYCTVLELRPTDVVLKDELTYEVRYFQNPMDSNQFMQVDLECRKINDPLKSIVMQELV